MIWRTRQQQNSKPPECLGARRKVQNLCCNVLTAPTRSGPSPGFQSLPGPQMLSPDCPHPGLPAGIKTPLLSEIPLCLTISHAPFSCIITCYNFSSSHLMWILNNYHFIQIASHTFGKKYVRGAPRVCFKFPCYFSAVDGTYDLKTPVAVQ